jgi:hypothetical protein
MKTRILSLLIIVALLFVPSSLVLAQGSGWAAVQAVPADDRLIVRQKDGKTITGKMIEANETSLTLTRDKKVVNIARDSIALVEHAKGKASKGKWALIGAGVGAGAGAGIGLAKSNSILDDGEIYILVGTVFGAGIGAGVGALIGANKRQREVIYSAP